MDLAEEDGFGCVVNEFAVAPVLSVLVELTRGPGKRWTWRCGASVPGWPPPAPAVARVAGRRSSARDQIELAQRLYDAGEHTVAQIAGMLKVPATTVNGHLNTLRMDSAPVAQESAVVARFTCPIVSDVAELRI